MNLRTLQYLMGLSTTMNTYTHPGPEDAAEGNGTDAGAGKTDGQERRDKSKQADVPGR